MGLQQVHMHLTGFSAVKTDFPNLYKPSTGFVVVKVVLPNYYRCLTNFAVDETGSTITYTASITFPVVKMGLANTVLEYFLWQWKMPCQASTVPQQVLR